jgi:hypothetical protein
MGEGVPPIIPECRGSLLGGAGRRNTNPGKKTRKTFSDNSRLSQQEQRGGRSMMNRDFALVRGQQMLAFLLAAIPLAERMLLYNVVIAACLMLPGRENG